MRILADGCHVSWVRQSSLAIHIQDSLVAQVSFSSKNCKFESQCGWHSHAWPEVQENKTGQAVWVGGAYNVSTVNHSNARQLWLSMSSCVRKRVDICNRTIFTVTSMYWHHYSFSFLTSKEVTCKKKKLDLKHFFINIVVNIYCL